MFSVEPSHWPLGKAHRRCGVTSRPISVVLGGIVQRVPGICIGARTEPGPEHTNTKHLQEEQGDNNGEDAIAPHRWSRTPVPPALCAIGGMQPSPNPPLASIHAIEARQLGDFSASATLRAHPIPSPSKRLAFIGGWQTLCSWSPPAHAQARTGERRGIAVTVTVTGSRGPSRVLPSGLGPVQTSGERWGAGWGYAQGTVLTLFILSTPYPVLYPVLYPVPRRPSYSTVPRRESHVSTEALYYTLLYVASPISNKEECPIASNLASPNSNPLKLISEKLGPRPEAFLPSPIFGPSVSF
ncbi:hypothetical protein CIB48_g4221 [Xylaria polymorpha]|nr:hypothetical protein CIB48_g4221 [Xylaria polymorpha]